MDNSEQMKFTYQTVVLACKGMGIIKLLAIRTVKNAICYWLGVHSQNLKLIVLI